MKKINQTRVDNIHQQSSLFVIIKGEGSEAATLDCLLLNLLLKENGKQLESEQIDFKDLHFVILFVCLVLQLENHFFVYMNVTKKVKICLVKRLRVTTMTALTTFH